MEVPIWPQRVFSLLGVNAPSKDDDLYGGPIRITDFVSGSTDRYATELSRRLSRCRFLKAESRWLTGFCEIGA
jgi:hypothetical protein